MFTKATEPKLISFETSAVHRLVFLTWTILSGVATAQRPQIIHIDPNSGLATVQTYDIFVLGNGEELYANPIWSRGMKRPVDIRRLEQLVFTPYDRDKGGIGYPTKKIQKVILWEDLATSKAYSLIGGQKFSTANRLVTELEKFNPKWQATAPLRARIEVHQSIEKSKVPGKQPEGIKELEALLSKYPSDSHVESSYVDLMLRLARQALDSENSDKATDVLNRARQSLPNSERLIGSARQWQRESRELITEAEQQQRVKSADAIVKAQRVIRLTRDAALRRRARIVIRNAEGLILASYETASAFEPFNATRPVERQVVHLIHDNLMQRDEIGHPLLENRFGDEDSAERFESTVRHRSSARRSVFGWLGGNCRRRRRLDRTFAPRRRRGV